MNVLLQVRAARGVRSPEIRAPKAGGGRGGIHAHAEPVEHGTGNVTPSAHALLHSGICAIRVLAFRNYCDAHLTAELPDFRSSYRLKAALKARFVSRSASTAARSR